MGDEMVYGNFIKSERFKSVLCLCLVAISYERLDRLPWHLQGILIHDLSGARKFFVQQEERYAKTFFFNFHILCETVFTVSLKMSIITVLVNIHNFHSYKLAWKTLAHLQWLSGGFFSIWFRGVALSILERIKNPYCTNCTHVLSYVRRIIQQLSKGENGTVRKVVRVRTAEHRYSKS